MYQLDCLIITVYMLSLTIALYRTAYFKQITIKH